MIELVQVDFTSFGLSLKCFFPTDHCFTLEWRRLKRRTMLCLNDYDWFSSYSSLLCDWIIDISISHWAIFSRISWRRKCKIKWDDFDEIYLNFLFQLFFTSSNNIHRNMRINNGSVAFERNAYENLFPLFSLDSPKPLSVIFRFWLTQLRQKNLKRTCYLWSLSNENSR